MSVPLYKQIATTIADQIRRGELREGDWVGSESELVSKYYVSSITARNALNELVDQGLVLRVRGKGTFVAAHACAITPARGRVTVRAILPTMVTRVEQKYLHYLEQACSERDDIDLTIRCSQESPEIEDKIIRQCGADGVQGIIVFPVVVETTPRYDWAVAQGRVPVVLIDRNLSDVEVSSVTSDNRYGAYLAATDLFDSAGPSVTMVHFPLYNNTIIDRFEGFRQAFEERGFPFTDMNALLIDDSSLLSASNRARVERICEGISSHLRAYPQVCGVFAGNVELAQTAYFTANQMGYTPGVDFQIVGFDNPHLPGVDYIEQDFQRIVSRAVEILRRHILGAGAVIRQKVPVRLVEVGVHPTLGDDLAQVVMGAGY